MNSTVRVGWMSALAVATLVSIGVGGCKAPKDGGATGETSTKATQNLDVKTIKVGEYSSMTGETAPFGRCSGCFDRRGFGRCAFDHGYGAFDRV